MPYFIYQMNASEADKLVRQLTLIERFENFKDAKNTAKRLRGESDSQDRVYKVIFADSPLQAEELLMEKREKPVLMEFER